MPDIGLLQSRAGRPRNAPKPEASSEAPREASVPSVSVQAEHEVAAPFLAPVDRAIAVVSAVVSEPAAERAMEDARAVDVAIADVPVVQEAIVVESAPAVAE